MVKERTWVSVKQDAGAAKCHARRRASPQVQALAPYWRVLAALSGKFATLDETALSNEELELLAKLRAMNGSLIAAGLEYETRKPLLAQYATRERTKAISASPKTREPSLCATSA